MMESTDRISVYKQIDTVMKNKKYILMIAALSVAAFSSCKDDDDSSDSAMSITQIYLEDADAEDNVTDRAVDFARLGQLIRIEGQGFTGLKAIYVNGYKTDFNNAMATDRNVWITLSSKTPIIDAEDDVRNTIRLYKSESNQFTYSFNVRSASPSATGFNNSLPQPGETVVVTGTNLHGTTQLTLPGGIVVTDVTSDDEDGEWYQFVMPEGVTEGGAIYSEGVNGYAYSPAYFNERGTMILDFDGGGVQGGWSATYTSEQDVEDPLGTGRGLCVPVVPLDILAEGGGIKNGAHGNGWFTAGNDVDDWNAYLPYIPAETSVADIALQFDIYCPEPWEGAGYLEFTLQNNLAGYGWGSANTKNDPEGAGCYAVCWCPWIDTATGETTPFQTTGWQTVTIPVSTIGRYQSYADYGYTMQSLIDDRNAGSYCNFGMFLVNSDITLDDGETVFETGTFNQPIYVDNWRIVLTSTQVVSDY